MDKQEILLFPPLFLRVMLLSLLVIGKLVLIVEYFLVSTATDSKWLHELGSDSDR